MESALSRCKSRVRELLDSPTFHRHMLANGALYLLVACFTGSKRRMFIYSIKFLYERLFIVSQLFWNTWVANVVTI